MGSVTAANKGGPFVKDLEDSAKAFLGAEGLICDTHFMGSSIESEGRLGTVWLTLRFVVVAPVTRVGPCSHNKDNFDQC